MTATQTDVNGNISTLATTATGTGGMTTGQKTGVALAITAVVAGLAELSRRMYRSRQEKAAAAAAADAAAAAHLKEMADMQKEMNQLRTQLDALLAQKISAAAN